MPKLSTREVTAIANAFYDLQAYAAITSDYPTATVAAEINEQRLMSTRTMKQMQNTKLVQLLSSAAKPK